MQNIAILLPETTADVMLLGEWEVNTIAPYYKCSLQEQFSKLLTAHISDIHFSTEINTVRTM